MGWKPSTIPKYLSVPPPILKYQSPSSYLSRSSPLRKSSTCSTHISSLKDKENISPPLLTAKAHAQSTKTNSILPLPNDANKHNNAYLSSPSTNTLTEVAKLTDKVNIKLDGKSVRSSRNRLNMALNRYCTSTVPKHLTSSSSKSLSQSGKNIFAKIKPSLTSVMSSAIALALTPPPALRRTSRRIKTLRSSTQSLLKDLILLIVCASNHRPYN